MSAGIAKGLLVSGKRWLSLHEIFTRGPRAEGRAAAPQVLPSAPEEKSGFHTPQGRLHASRLVDNHLGETQESKQIKTLKKNSLMSNQ